MDLPDRHLYLCAGTQSSGSTLISWCFLQRCDMDGVLDADNDYLPSLPAGLGRPLTWYKTTISSFRLVELAAHFADEGWHVHPLLIVRDVRAVWASMVRKSYVRNGITAEDPPIRLRLRRFKEDWEACRRLGWPVLCYERFVDAPEAALRAACAGLGLPWSIDMLEWPKEMREIADARHGNRTFRESRRNTLAHTLRDGESRGAPRIPADELAWLEDEFRDFNQINGYPHSLVGAAESTEGAPHAPRLEVTRRHSWELRRKPLRWLMWNLGWRGPFLPGQRRMAAVADRARARAAISAATCHTTSKAD